MHWSVLDADGSVSCPGEFFNCTWASNKSSKPGFILKTPCRTRLTLSLRGKLLMIPEISENAGF